MALWKKAVWMLIWCTPAIWIGWLVIKNGVDVPILDQWDGTYLLFEKADAGTLGMSDFFAQHNEHRMFFPRLIMFLLGKLTHWNVWAELGLIWMLGWLCVLSIWRLALTTGWDLFRAGWPAFAVSALVFTPLGFENWLMGFQIGLLVPVACFVGCLSVASSTRFPFNFLLSMVICTVCTLSIASGFTCWLLTFPLLMLPEGKLDWSRKRVWWLLWGAGFLITTVVYFHGYTKPAVHPDMSLAVKHPISASQFFLAYLGAPFAHGTALEATLVSQIAGAALVALLFLACAYLWFWRHDRALTSRALPWVMCSLIALFNGGLITIGRMGFGVSEAMASRYQPLCATLPISLLFLGPLVFQHWSVLATSGSRRVLRVGMGLSALTAGFALLFLMGEFPALGDWRERHLRGLAAKAVVELINVIDDPEAVASPVHPRSEIVRPRANVLDRLGYLRPPLIRSRAIRQIADPAAKADGHQGAIVRSGRVSTGQFAMVGWAILPERRRQADVVVLTYDDPNGEPLIFSLALVGVSVTRVAGAPQEAGYETCGWSKVFDPGGLPPGAHLLRAWAFDAEKCRAYPLGEAVDLIR